MNILELLVALLAIYFFAFASWLTVAGWALLFMSFCAKDRHFVAILSWTRKVATAILQTIWKNVCKILFVIAMFLCAVATGLAGWPKVGCVFIAAAFFAIHYWLLKL